MRDISHLRVAAAFLYLRARGGYTFQINIYGKNGKFVRHEFIDATRNKCPMRYVNGAMTKEQKKLVNTTWCSSLPYIRWIPNL